MNISKLSIFFLASSAFASYSPITNLDQFGSSAFSMYGLVANGDAANHNFDLSSDTAITGNVGFDNTTFEQSISLNNGTITGNYNTQGTNAARGGGGTVTGTIAGSVAAVDDAVQDATSLFGLYTALTSLPTIAGSVNLTGLTGNDGANEFVYAAGTSLTGLTITASNNDYVIINVGETYNGTNPPTAGASGYDLNSIRLSGGITADHVLVDVDTTGNLQAGPNNSDGNTGNPIVNAIVIDDAGVTNLNSITINGSLFCTTGPGDCHYVSNAVLNQQAFVPGAPEPATWLLGLCGMAAIAARKRFRRSHESASKSN